MKDKLKITIRRAEVGDKSAVMNLLKATAFFRADELPTAEEVFDDAATGADPDYQSFVALDGDKPIGWVCFGDTPCTIGTFDVYWVAVDPEYQNCGIGRALMQFSEDAIKAGGGRMIVVETSGNSHYISTRKFYEKIGFTVEACLKDFYTEGDDKIVYIKRV